MNIRILLEVVAMKIINFFIKPLGREIWMEVDVLSFDSFIEDLRNEIQGAKSTGKGYRYCYEDLQEAADEFYKEHSIKVTGWEEVLRKEWDMITG